MSRGNWQLICTEMKQRFAYLLSSGLWSDIDFMVGLENHQVVIQGHKFILVTASPVFEAMFYGEIAEGNDPILVPDMEPEAFKALLEYIYTDNIGIDSFEKACELYYGAKKYMFPQLVEECKKYLFAEIGPNNACRAYEFAQFYEESVLMDKSIQIIRMQTTDVLRDSSFDEVEFNTVIMVLSQDELNINSELDLFNAVERYAIANGLDKGEGDESVPNGLDKGEGDKSVPSTSETSEDTEEKQCDVVNAESSESSDAPTCAGDNSSSSLSRPDPSTQSGNTKDTGLKQQKKLSIRRAIELIRFLTLTPEQFAQGPAQSSLLTESQSYAILINIVLDNAKIAMPAGFSRYRQSR